MIKRLTIFLALLTAATSLASVAPVGVQAQNRHVYLEEFTGSWCGYCVRGAAAIQTLDAKYPGQVFITSIHGDFAGSHRDPMETAQGDSMIDGLGGAQVEGRSFPDGWTARTSEGTNGWNVDPQDWIDTLDGFKASATPGLVDAMVGQKASATVVMDNLTFDVTTHMVSVRLTTTFANAMTGDLRMNVIVTEDSVTGTEQTNYYYQCPSIPGNSTSNPFYNLGAGVACDGMISDWYNMHVFRSAVAGVWGSKGVIPASAVAATPYSQTFTFPLPANVTNPNQVHLMGIVHQFSATDKTKNQVLDVAESKLTTTPVIVKSNSLDVSLNGGPYYYAKANGDTSILVSVTNNDPVNSVTVKLSVNSAASLPAGWTAKFDNASVVVPPLNSINSYLTITAPDQSAYVTPTITIEPQETGVFFNDIAETFAMLSDNTRVPFFMENIFDAGLYQAIPVELSTHMAVIPNSTAIMDAYNFDPATTDLAIFDDPDFLDQTGAYSSPGAALPVIESMLAGGKPVFFNSDLAMGLQYDPQFNGYANIHTDDGQDFYENVLGITYRATENKTSNNTYVSFKINATSDPIGKNTPSVITAAGSQFVTPFDVDDTKSTSLFYFDGNTKLNAGVRYTDPNTHGKMVYLGFNLGTLPIAAADTIAKHSIQWLLSTDAATGAVAQNAVTPSGMEASANPFHGTTQITYTPAAGDGNVSFSVYDVLGREVTTLTPRVAAGNALTTTFDGSTLADGAYTVVAHTSNGTRQIRIVNQK